MFEAIAQWSSIDQVFLVFAGIGTVIFTFRLILMIAGFGGDVETDGGAESVDGHCADIPDGADQGDAHDHDGGQDPDGSLLAFKLLSFQGVIVFGMMFGYFGLTASKTFLLPAIASIPVGIAGGLSMVWLLAKLFRAFGKLHSSGTADLSDALGKEGLVYLTIPGKDQGQVRVEVSGHHRIMNAVSEQGRAIPTDSRVLVVGLVSGNVLVVQQLS